VGFFYHLDHAATKQHRNDVVRFQTQMGSFPYFDFAWQRLLDKFALFQTQVGSFPHLDNSVPVVLERLP
jgi:hypothetical protein